MSAAPRRWIRLAACSTRTWPSGTPGTFDADGWTTRAYVVKAEPQTITSTMVETQLTGRAPGRRVAEGDHHGITIRETDAGHADLTTRTTIRTTTAA